MGHKTRLMENRISPLQRLSSSELGSICQDSKGKLSVHFVLKLIDSTEEVWSPKRPGARSDERPRIFDARALRRGKDGSNQILYIYRQWQMRKLLKLRASNNIPVIG